MLAFCRRLGRDRGPIWFGEPGFLQSWLAFTRVTSCTMKCIAYLGQAGNALHMGRRR